MAQQNVCTFNKFGYCKFKQNCRKQHITEKCENDSCDTKTCNLRHPRVCRYFRDIGFCKFGEWCLFNHEWGTNEVKEKKRKLNILRKLSMRKQKKFNR